MRTLMTVAAGLLLIAAVSTAQIKSAKSGVWSADTTWVGGVVPTANDDVLIDTSTTVTVNVANAVCKNMTVKGTVTFPDVNALGIVINGDLLIESTGKFNTYSSGSPLGIRYQTIELKKNLTVMTGGSFDMRRGSGATVGVGRVVFTGTENSVITLSQTAYGSSVEEFNSVIINKSGGAKVVLAAGNLYQNNNATNAPDTLLFISGIVETGDNTWVHLATSSGSIQGASDASHIVGRIGRGLTNSGGNVNRPWPLGDGTVLRPISLRMTAPANATGHYVWAALLPGNANTGSSAFAGGIDKVSGIRYYQVGYLQNAGSAASVPFYGFTPSYRDDDGVNAGNSDLRVAVSTDARANWTGYGPASDTTKVGATYYSVASDSIVPLLTVNTGTSLFVALARATGTVTNPLEGSSKAPQFAVSPKSINFGTTPQNIYKNDSVTVSNAGDDTLKVTDIVSDSPDFVAASTDLVVAPGGSVKMYVFFEPTSVGPKSGRIIFTHNAASGKDTLTVSGTASPVQSVRPGDGLPAEFALHQNYPNPFNPSTVISFSMPERAAVKAEVFTLLGTRVAVLFDGVMGAGTHSLQWNAKSVPSGVYFYRVAMGSKVFTKQMMLLK